jgi:hypothetical protein
MLHAGHLVGAAGFFREDHLRHSTRWEGDGRFVSSAALADTRGSRGQRAESSRLADRTGASDGRL